MSLFACSVVSITIRWLGYRLKNMAAMTDMAGLYTIVYSSSLEEERALASGTAVVLRYKSSLALSVL